MVSTNALLGHAFDHNTSKFLVSLYNTFYKNMTTLSSFRGRFVHVIIFYTFRAFSAR